MTEDYHIDLNGQFILDEQGNKIPKSICMCAAWEPNECICGAWDDVDPEEWYKDYVE